jgi:hypothetical protein
MLPQLLTVTEVARLKGLSRTAVYNAMNRGALPYTNLLGKRAVKASDAKKWRPTGKKTGRPKGIAVSSETKRKISEGQKERWRRTRSSN